MPAPSPQHAQDPSLVALGAAIRRARKERGISQEELASRSAVDRSYMSSIERGQQNPGIVSVLRIARAMQMNAAELIAREHPPHQPHPLHPPESARRPPPSARERLAQHVRDYRHARDWSQAEMAGHTGLHRTYIGAIEQARANASIDNIERIALALGVDIADLLGVSI